MKKAIIINHNGGELANQLWNYASIYAYCLDRGRTLTNPSFYEYASWFPNYRTNKIFWFFFVLPFYNYTKRKKVLKRKLWRKFYALFSWFISRTNSDALITPLPGTPYYLPPTKTSDEIAKKEILPLLYFNGWLFRNPEGLKKYQKEIVQFFRPNNNILQKIDKITIPARSKFSHLVGVHIRQGDYRTWQSGKYYISQERTRVILDEYLENNKDKGGDTLFIITSDEKINPEIFKGLNIEISKGNAIEDLFLLSKTDVIIGSNSTYGDFAAYYGNIPHIIMSNDSIDWEYYHARNEYFMGKYATWVHF